MQSKFLFEYQPNGNLIACTSQGDKLYEGQVGTAEYILQMKNNADSDNWLPTDIVFIAFAKSNGDVVNQRMHYIGNNQWRHMSNGWETDFTGMATSHKIGVSFICRRYNSSMTSVVTKTTSQTMLEVYPSGEYNYQDSVEAGSADEFLQEVVYLESAFAEFRENAVLVNVSTEVFTKEPGTQAEFKIEQQASGEGEYQDKTLIKVGIPQGNTGENGKDYVLTDEDRNKIAERAADMVAYIQPEEPEDAAENSLWVDTSQENDAVSQSVLATINNGITVIDDGLTYSRGVVEVRRIGSILWIIDSGVYNFTSNFNTAANRTVHQFDLPKVISNKIPNVNGVYGAIGTIGYFPALAYENVTYTTFNCQSYLKRSAIGDTYDTYQLVYTGLGAVNGGGLCGFHLKMPIIIIEGV